MQVEQLKHWPYGPAIRSASLREHGLQVRPRYAQGSTCKVVGYSVRLADTGHGRGRAVWYGGGRLARDLTLPALRRSSGQEQAEETRAVEEWRSRSGVGLRSAAEQRAELEQRGLLWHRCTAEIERVRCRCEQPAPIRGVWARGWRGRRRARGELQRAVEIETDLQVELEEIRERIDAHRPEPVTVERDGETEAARRAREPLGPATRQAPESPTHVDDVDAVKRLIGPTRGAGHENAEHT